MHFCYKCSQHGPELSTRSARFSLQRKWSERIVAQKAKLPVQQDWGKLFPVLIEKVMQKHKSLFPSKSMELPEKALWPTAAVAWPGPSRVASLAPNPAARRVGFLQGRHSDWPGEKVVLNQNVLTFGLFSSTVQNFAWKSFVIPPCPMNVILFCMKPHFKHRLLF